MLLLLLFIFLFPVQASDGLESAQQLFKQGKFHEAAAAYRSIAEKDKTNARAYSGLVESYLKAEEVENADRVSAQALSLMPGSALIHAARGDVFFRQGLLAEAEAQYQSALQIDSKCARAWFGMGKIDAIVARQSKAKEAFTRAHELDPSDGDILYRWAITLAYPDNVKQLEHYLAEYRTDPEDERHKREYVGFVRAIAGRDIWTPINPPSRAEVKLEPVFDGPSHPRGMGVHVKFNDGHNSVLRLDTGASGVTITRKLAEKIGARRMSEYGLEGVGDAGPVAGYVAWVDKISIGDLQFRDCPVHVSNDTHIGAEDGLVGTDVLARYLVTIDFPRHKLLLGPLPAPPEDSHQALVRSAAAAQPNTQSFSFGHIILIPTRVSQTGFGLFVLDTGDDADSISPALARQVSRLHASTMRVGGVSGQVKEVLVAEDVVLQFSRAPLPSENLQTFDVSALSKDLGTELSGFVGFSSLNHMRVIIDYRDGWVDFETK